MRQWLTSGGPVVHHNTLLTCRSPSSPFDAPHSPLFCSVRKNTPPHVTLLHHWRPAAASLWGLLELHWPQLELLAQQHSRGFGWSCSLPLSASSAQIAAWQEIPQLQQYDVMLIMRPPGSNRFFCDHHHRGSLNSSHIHTVFKCRTSEKELQKNIIRIVRKWISWQTFKVFLYCD